MATDRNIKKLNDDERGNKEATYHVHRVYLASGPRKSEYFQTLFSLATHTEESASRTTKLILPESACSICPLLLDFIYGGGQEFISGLWAHFDNHVDIEVASREAVALHFLADYLRVPKLIPVTKAFVQKLLDDSNVHIVCREALVYGIDWIITDCITIAATSPRDFFSPTLEMGSSSSVSSSKTPDTQHSSQLYPPASQTFDMLPLERQTELLKLSLSHTLRELERFKRVPSRWKDDIDDVAATHMPTLMLSKEKADGENRMRDFRLAPQGCGLPFPDNKICPLFYFDREHNQPASSPLAQSDVQKASGFAFPFSDLS